MAVRLLLIDALNLIRRVHAGTLAADGGAIVEACVGSFKRGLRGASPTHAAFVLDGAGPTWRHREFADYKLGRRPMPEELSAVMPDIRAAVELEGVLCLAVAATEADDVIATIASAVALRGGRVRILSTDRAFLALLGGTISVRDHFGRKNFTSRDVVARFGVGPSHLIDLWALSGFIGTGVPGVPGIGPKTAVRLLTEYGDLDSILQAASEIEGKLGQRLVEHADTARKARPLVALRTDIEVGVNLNQMRYAS